MTLTRKQIDERKAKRFSWGETFNRHLAKGEDHGAAAYMADKAEARARRAATPSTPKVKE